MIHTDRNALICDLAETYGIYDMGSLPARTVAILASGLRDNSRIKMKLTGMKVDSDLLLLAYAVDRLGILIWQQTKDGQRGRNQPESIAEKILRDDSDRAVRRGHAFNSGEEFEKARERILKKIEGAEAQ